MDYKRSLKKLLVLAIFTYLFFSVNNTFAEQRKNKIKNFSDVVFYGRIYVQYDSIKAGDSGSTPSVSNIRDDEGMSRFGVKGKSFIGGGYAVNFKVEYAIDLGDGTATSDSTNCAATTTDCRTFALKEGWLGTLTPYGQIKIGSMESPYKYMAKHDILHDTISQARDSRIISQGSMAHSSYWRESILYEFKSQNLEFAFIKGFGESANNTQSDGDYGLGIQYKNFLLKGFDVVYAYNHDDSANDGATDKNNKITFTYNMKMADKRKIKIWYMHEDVGLDSKMFTGGTSSGENDWIGIQYASGPIKLQYSFNETDDDGGSDYDRDGYNLGAQYKLSKTSRLYLGYSKSDSNHVTKDVKTTMIGIRHDF